MSNTTHSNDSLAALQGLVHFEVLGPSVPGQSKAGPGLPDIKIHLVDGYGVVRASTRTDAQGRWALAGITPGLYTVELGQLPEGCRYTSDHANADEPLGCGPGMTDVVKLEAGKCPALAVPVWGVPASAEAFEASVQATPSLVGVTEVTDVIDVTDITHDHPGHQTAAAADVTDVMHDVVDVLDAPDDAAPRKAGRSGRNASQGQLVATPTETDAVQTSGVRGSKDRPRRKDDQSFRNKVEQVMSSQVMLAEAVSRLEKLVQVSRSQQADQAFLAGGTPLLTESLGWVPPDVYDDDAAMYRLCVEGVADTPALANQAPLDASPDQPARRPEEMRELLLSRIRSSAADTAALPAPKGEAEVAPDAAQPTGTARQQGQFSHG